MTVDICSSDFFKVKSSLGMWAIQTLSLGKPGRKVKCSIQKNRNSVKPDSLRPQKTRVNECVCMCVCVDNKKPERMVGPSGWGDNLVLEQTLLKKNLKASDEERKDEG